MIEAQMKNINSGCYLQHFVHIGPSKIPLKIDEQIGDYKNWPIVRQHTQNSLKMGAKMDTKTDPKSHKPPLGQHSQITLCTAHPNCTKISKNDVQKGPQNEPQKEGESELELSKNL